MGLAKGDQEASIPHLSLSVSTGSHVLVVPCFLEMKPGSSEQQCVCKKVIDPNCSAMSQYGLPATKINKCHIHQMPHSDGHHVRVFITNLMWEASLSPL